MFLERFVFHPDPTLAPIPAGVDEVDVTTPDGETLRALRLEVDPGAPWLLWSHGNGGNIYGRADAVVGLGSLGLNVFAYDYRGYGTSTGSPTERGVYRDVLAAYDHLVTAGVSPDRIVSFGQSLGGAVSIYLATHRKVLALVVGSTFTTVADVARTQVGPLSILLRGWFPSLRRIGSVRVPIFVSHGDADDLVPFELGERLFAAAPEPKQFLRQPGGGHDGVLDYPGTAAAIAAFIHGADAKPAG